MQYKAPRMLVSFIGQKTIYLSLIYQTVKQAYFFLVVHMISLTDTIWGGGGGGEDQGMVFLGHWLKLKKFSRGASMLTVLSNTFSVLKNCTPTEKLG